MINTDELVIRRELREGDVEAIADLHRRVYGPEYGTNEAFVEGVAGALRDALARGWPAGGGVWLVHRDGQLCGSVGLTDEGDGVGWVRWVVLHPVLRGRGLGRELINEVVGLARANGMHELGLDTFSELTTAAHIYRSVGFQVVSERQRVDWGRAMTYQRYIAQLR